MFQTINPFSFSTNRFIVRLVEYGDYPDYFEICSNKTVTKYLTFEPYLTIKDAKRTIINMIRSYYLGECVNFSIVEKITNKVIGSISLTFFANNNQSEIGYLINESFQNKHVMSEIMPLFIKYSFEYYKIDLLFARVLKDNIYSIRLLEKNNFEYAHTLINGVKVHNLVKNVLYYTYSFDKYFKIKINNE